MDHPRLRKWVVPAKKRKAASPNILPLKEHGHGISDPNERSSCVPPQKAFRGVMLADDPPPTSQKGPFCVYTPISVCLHLCGIFNVTELAEPSVPLTSSPLPPWPAHPCPHAAAMAVIPVVSLAGYAGGRITAGGSPCPPQVSRAGWLATRCGSSLSVEQARGLDPA